MVLAVPETVTTFGTTRSAIIYCQHTTYIAKPQQMPTGTKHVRLIKILNRGNPDTYWMSIWLNISQVIVNLT
jgi:hypothetical protein